MLLTPHTLVGVALGANIQNPYLAASVSFGTHFILDTVPHWDFYTGLTKKEMNSGWRPIAVMVDLALGVSIGLFFTLYALWVLKNPTMALSIFLSGIAAVLPDGISLPSIHTNKPIPIVSSVSAVQIRLQAAADPFWGILTQVVACGFSLLLIAHSIGL